MKIYVLSDQSDNALERETIKLTDHIPDLSFIETPDNADIIVFDAEKKKDLDQKLRSLKGHPAELWWCSKANRTPEYKRVRVISPISSDPLGQAERIVAEIARKVAIDRDYAYFSKEMHKLFERATRFAKTDLPILITGEPGTGKSFLAKEMHHISEREPIISVNGGEFSPALLASEIYGHVRGAFTGADKDRDGLMVEAGEGTFFLDEIAEIPSEQQSLLLTVIEDKTVRPVGSNKRKQIHARLLFATNRDLVQMVADEKFRKDLLDRFNFCTLELTPLRSRRVDILLLTDKFLKEACSKYQKDLLFSDKDLDVLFSRNWPGNIRELKNLITTVVALSDENQLAQQELLDGTGRSSASKEKGIDIDPNNETLIDFEKRMRMEYVKKALSLEPSVARAAKLAGISRARMYEIRDELDL